MSLVTRTNGQVTATLKASPGIESLQATYTQPLTLFLDNGSGASNVADQVYSEERTLAPGGGHTFDLKTINGGSDAAGNPFSFATIKALTLVNTNGTHANNIVAGGAPAGGAGWTGFSTGTITVNGNSGFYFFCPDATGYTVSPSDLFKISNPSGQNVMYDLLIVGSTV